MFTSFSQVRASAAANRKLKDNLLDLRAHRAQHGMCNSCALICICSRIASVYQFNITIELRTHTNEHTDVRECV